VWFWSVTVPSLAVLAAVGAATARSLEWHRLHTALVVGAIYGVLILGADSSGPWTGLTGWMFHFANGIGFGITYAVIAAGRRWQWALLWGLAIETLAVALPFAGLYVLRGPVLLAIAYGGHLAYGAVLGKLAAHPERTASQLSEVSAHTLAYALLVVLVALVAWQRPFLTPASVRDGKQGDSGASAVVRDGRFQPEWMRVSSHGCVTLRNDDPASYVLADAVGAPRLEPGRTARACFATAAAVMRVRLSPEPYSGGFVIVDGSER
jgi:hypothetical protein